MITDLLKFTIKEGTDTEAIQIFRKQMENNLGDDGCLISSMFRSKSKPDEFYLLLGWDSPEAIEKHLKSDHDLKFREDLDPLLAAPPEFFDWEEI